MSSSQSVEFEGLWSRSQLGACLLQCIGPKPSIASFAMTSLTKFEEFEAIPLADAGLQRNSRIEPGHRRGQFQPSLYRALCVVFMGLRIAEIHQRAVAQVLRHEAVEAADDLADAFAIGRNDLA